MKKQRLWEARPGITWCTPGSPISALLAPSILAQLLMAHPGPPWFGINPKRGKQHHNTTAPGLGTDHSLLLVRVPQRTEPIDDPMDCSPAGSSVHGILQARILEWVFFYYFLLQRIFPTSGSNQVFPHSKQSLYCLSHQGSPVDRWINNRDRQNRQMTGR